MTESDLMKEMREVKLAMKEQGIRRISCFNGGLSTQEYRMNSRLFRLKAQLADLKAGPYQEPPNVPMMSRDTEPGFGF